MKRIVLVALCLILIILIGCADSARIPEEESNQAVLGVISTSGSVKDSSLLFFDESLQLIQRYPLPYASVSDSFYVPEVVGDDLYLPTQGFANVKDEEIVLQVNLKKLETKTHFIGQPAINCLCLDQNFLYTCNTLDNISYISRLDLQNKKLQNYQLQDVYVTKLLADNQFLYAFGTKFGEELSASLYLFNHALENVKTLDISPYGITQYKAIQDDDFLYFSNLVDANDKPNNLVARIDKKTGEIQAFQLEHGMPNDLLLMDGFLLIAHFNPMTGQSDGLSFLNLETEVTTHQPLEHGIEQMVLLDHSLFILHDGIIYEYRVDDNSLNFVRQGVVPFDDQVQYSSGFFKMP